jgi:hypothetical protein
MTRQPAARREAPAPLLGVGDQTAIAQRLGRAPRRAVEHGAGVTCPVAGDPRDFDGLPIVEQAGHGTADDRHPTQYAGLIGDTDAEPQTLRGAVVAMVVGDELAGVAEPDRNKV